MAQTHTIKSTFQVASWDEQAWDVRNGAAKLTRADVTKSYAGEIEGSSTTVWLMAYASDGSATFVGLERIAGTVAGRAGTLVLQHMGGYADGAARATLTLVEGAGSGDLAA